MNHLDAYIYLSFYQLSMYSLRHTSSGLIFPFPSSYGIFFEIFAMQKMELDLHLNASIVRKST